MKNLDRPAKEVWEEFKKKYNFDKIYLFYIFLGIFSVWCIVKFLGILWQAFISLMTTPVIAPITENTTNVSQLFVNNTISYLPLFVILLSFIPILNLIKRMLRF